MNIAVLIGRLTADPEMRITPNGTNVTNFSIAVDRFGDNDETDFFDVTCWRGTAKAVANNLGKGRLVAVRGELRQDRWQTDSGQNRSKVKVNAQEVKFLDWPQEAKKQSNDIDVSDIDEEDVPF